MTVPDDGSVPLARDTVKSGMGNRNDASGTINERMKANKEKTAFSMDALGTRDSHG